MTPKYLFDTNVFNRIFELEIEEEWFPRDAQYFMTHIQRDELAKTPDPLRRLHLMFVLSSVGPTSISTASAMWNVSKWDQCEWGSEDGLFQKMLKSLNARNGGKKNNGSDVLIGETALRNDCRLVTDDADLATVVREFHGKTMTFSEFLTLSEK
jgi:predicted nucleic acid-binding protein